MKRKETKGMGAFMVAVIAIFAIGGPVTEIRAQEKKAETDNELVTLTYIVPTNIHELVERHARELEKQRAEDRRNDEGIRRGLEHCGIEFPKGASVVYNPGSSTIVIRNTQEQIDEVEHLLDRTTETFREIHRVFVTFKEIRFNPEELRKEIGGREEPDWLSEELRKKIGGREEPDWLFWEPPRGIGVPEGSTGGASTSTVEDLLQELSRPPIPPSKAVRPAGSGIAGTLSDPQFQMYFRALSHLKSIDLLSSPSILLRSGEAGLSQVDENRWGVVASKNPDEESVDLDLYFPREGQALFPGNSKVRPTSADIGLWDGHTAIYREPLSEDEVRMVFVTAKLIKHSGIKSERLKSDSPGKPKPKPVTAEAKPEEPAKPKAPSPPADPKRKLTEEEMASVRAADQIALEGSRKLAADQYEVAMKDFEVAVKKLPDHPLVEDRRKAYTKQLENARHQLKNSGEDAGGVTARKLRTLVVPALDFQDTPLTDALAFLGKKSGELDHESSRQHHGIDLILAGPKERGDTRITLKLRNVPLGEAIRYTAKLANCRADIEGRTVILSPIKNNSGELYTNTYIVPPNFLSSGQTGSGGAAGRDPFAESGQGSAEALVPKKTAKEVLENYGLTFGSGASATYNPTSSVLIVRQTLDQMELVEAVIESLIPKPENQILLVFRVIETRAPLFPEVHKEKAKSRDDLFDPDSGARVHGASETPWLAGPGLAISKVLTTDEAAELVERFEGSKKKDGQIRLARPLAVRSGQRAEIWIGEVVAEIDSVIGPDNLTVDLNLGVGIGEPAAGFNPTWTTSVTIWDGQTVVLKETKRGKKRYQTILLAATIVDPAGIPLAKEPPPVELPEKDGDETKGPGWEPASLFPKPEPPKPTPAPPVFPEFVLKGDEKLIIHQVKKGDTLYQLAKNHGPPVSRIKEANRMRSDVMTVGDRIFIPVKIRDHFLEKVEARWEPEPPAWIPDKARAIIVPAIEFVDTPLSDALEFLRDKSIELDGESPEDERGFNFLLENLDSVGKTKVTLRLSNVPLSEAIRYTTQLANCDYEIEGRTVTISPKKKAGKAMIEVNNLKPTAKSDSGIDPADVWFSAFTLLQEGEAAEKSGENLKALAKYNEAAPLFDGLARQFPNFYPEIIRYRRENLKERREQLRQSIKRLNPVESPIQQGSAKKAKSTTPG